MSVQLHRAIDLLERLQTAADPLSLAELAKSFDLPKSAAHRLLQVWVARGYVEQDPASQRYFPTLRLAILGFAHLGATGLRDVAQPELKTLAERTGELARLAVADGSTLTWMVEAQGARGGLRYDANLGRQAILSATAAGKAWLSTMSDEAAVKLVLEQGFGAEDETGPRAIRTVEAVLNSLEETRASGYATSLEEAAAGVTSVAAPVFARPAGGVAVGAVIVVGPSVRMTPERIPEVAIEVRATALRISELWPLRSHLAPAPGSGDGR